MLKLTSFELLSLALQYDLYTTSYSPDGRVFQVEYAAKAVETSGTAVGVRCKDGVVLGFEKLVISKMLVEVPFCCAAAQRSASQLQVASC